MIFFVANNTFLIFSSAVAVLREEGSLIYAANKSEFVVRNMVLFVLKMMRDEWYRLKWGVDALCNPYDSLNVSFY